MAWTGNGGAQPMDVDPFEILAPLAAAATVRIHEAPAGYDGGGPVSQPWGSGFFVAPNWVLTCAHVALRGGRAEGGWREVGLSFQGVDGPVTGRVEWAQPEEGAGGSWPAPDLALIRLVEPVSHPCVWLTERTAKVFTRSEVAFFGWLETPDGTENVSGRCTIRGELGTDGLLKLGNEDEFPEGVSGGPVVDLRRGEVIGVLKARRSAGRDGGLATSVVQLRRLPAPVVDDLYQRVLHAHDRHHAERHRDVAHFAERTWTDAQSDLRATADRALTPGQRVELLGLLAELPSPLSTRRLDEMVTELAGRPYHGTLPAPRGWRDGLGRLYGAGEGTNELWTVLRYAVHAATAERPRPADRPRAAVADAESRLLAWVDGTAAGAELPRWFRTALRLEQEARLREREARAKGPGPDTLADVWSFDPGPPDGHPGMEQGPFVLLEITPHGWERGRYDWRVCNTAGDGEFVSIDEGRRETGPGDLPPRLGAALREAFRRGDEPDRPVPLQIALPYSLLRFSAEDWALTPGGPSLGEQRPVVFRCTDPIPEDQDSEEVRALRLARWAKLHVGRMVPDILDCADGRSRPLPEADVLVGRDPATVPVLCHTPATGGEPTALLRVMTSGYNVILWRREITEREPGCGDFHRGVDRTVTGAGHAGRLPGAVWRLRALPGAGAPGASWSRGLALLYSDPHRPLPGADDPLETL
ncbi:trypsin-like peptidase domain-containing protein [Streptomyces sp. SBT349]|uniref:VMAP-C domain-containing protein n=1 Tax=Streptomyces sp. SBT349 TaxID=1580539 RepID=UPI00131D7BCF|nr:trypsin-like peptidase domain-containing protein [Streptomyces sp. SBT349]